MNKIISFSLLILALCALENTEIHQQARPATPTANNYPAPSFNYRPPTPTPIVKPIVPVTPSPVTTQVRHQPHKEIGYQPTPGNPFGRDPQGHLTCFRSPCYDPTTSCTKASTRAVIGTNSRIVHGTPVSFNTRARKTYKKIGTWKPIVYVVRVNGRRARFAGFRCTLR